MMKLRTRLAQASPTSAHVSVVSRMVVPMERSCTQSSPLAKNRLAAAGAEAKATNRNRPDALRSFARMSPVREIIVVRTRSSVSMSRS